MVQAFIDFFRLFLIFPRANKSEICFKVGGNHACIQNITSPHTNFTSEMVYVAWSMFSYCNIYLIQVAPWKWDKGKSCGSSKARKAHNSMGNKRRIIWYAIP